MLKVLGSLTLRQWLFSWVHADISLLLTLVPRIRLCIGWGKVIQHSVVTEGQSHGANEWEMGFKLISSAPTLKHCLRARCLCNGILRLLLFSSPSQNICTDRQTYGFNAERTCSSPAFSPETVGCVGYSFLSICTRLTLWTSSLSFPSQFIVTEICS